MNLRDRDNLRAKDKRPVPKVSFVQRLDCNIIILPKNLVTRVKLMLVDTHLTLNFFMIAPCRSSIPW